MDPCRGFAAGSNPVLGAITPLTTWTVYDKEKTDFVNVRADTWKQAVKEAMKRGIKPREHLDVRPRKGEAPKTPCVEIEEFQEFMEDV